METTKGLRKGRAAAHPAEPKQAQEPIRDQSPIKPQQTCRWNEQAPDRSQARRVQPGQAQSRVPTISCTRLRWSVHRRPCCAGAPQGLWQLTGQTQPFGMAIVRPHQESATSGYGFVIRLLDKEG